MENTYAKSTGTAKLYLQKHGDRHSSNVNWNMDYDGELADIDLDVTVDGEKDRYNIVLDNDDLTEILHKQSVKKPLEQRLYDDYLIDRKVYKLEPKKRRHVISVKRRRPIKIIKLKKKKPTKKKSRKNKSAQKKKSKRSSSRKTSKSKRKSSRRTPRPKTKRIHLSKRSSRKSRSSRRSKRSKSSRSTR